jgi:hypothetical protein
VIGVSGKQQVSSLFKTAVNGNARGVCTFRKASKASFEPMKKQGKHEVFEGL